MNPSATPSPADPPVTEIACAASVPSPRRWRLTWRQGMLLLLAAAGIAVFSVWRYRVTRPEYQLERAQAAIRAQDWDTVAEIAQRLYDAGHRNYAAVLRAEGVLVLGRQSQDPAKKRTQAQLALSELNKMELEDFPLNAPLRVHAASLSAQCYLELGNLAEAHRVFLFVLDQQPDHIDAHRGLAAIAYDLGHIPTAIRHLETVARLDPSDPRPHRQLGLIHSDLGEHEKATEAYYESLRRGIDGQARSEVQFELAEVLLHLARFSEAIAVLDSARTHGEEAPWLVAIRAEAYRGLGRREEAIALLDRAIVAHPNGGALYRIRGQLYLDENNPVAAVTCLERAVELSPWSYQPQYLLSQAYAAAGRKEDAARAARKVDELRREYTLLSDLTREAMNKPGDATVRRRLAEVCDRLGKPELAAMWRSAAATVGGGR
jgi:tetratricopeptide (TPR) repeat protein